ncbi:MAG: ATP-dependent ligase [Chthoniobacteraceae bacterium]|nr:ATP-dependent ligase [Chthoniobacteraceae bacterium]
MRRFTRLFVALDETNRTNEKVAALESYFREANPRDAAWALHFLSGRKLPRTVTSTALRNWAAEAAGLPSWLVEECHDAVGDLAETAALLLPDTPSTIDLPLHELIENRLLPMRDAPETMRKEMLLRTWSELDAKERLVWNKLITGSFRVGVAQTLVVRALASVAGVEQAIMAHRFTGRWQPTADDFNHILNPNPEAGGEVARPYPFFLASPLEGNLEALGPLSDWQAEWKWDGIRAQLIRRQGEVLVWSRGDEMITESFPEIAEAGRAFPDGTVLDGEILAWQGELPEPFSRLQRRLGRKVVSRKMRGDVPVVFLAYDLLEWKGEDWRARTLEERRRQLESALDDALHRPVEIAGKPLTAIGETFDLFELEHFSPIPALPLRLSAVLTPDSWESLLPMQHESRVRGVEGIMFKRRSSPYGVGRQRGDWWKWKIDPFVMDAVLINAQLGHGRRASLYTDYTFAIWHENKLIPVAKAYSGLSDAEILEVDAFVRANTTDKFGPIRAVKPELVFELAFEAVQESTRHKAGIAVRFPRMSRWRHDKKAADADTLENLRALLRVPR